MHLFYTPDISGSTYQLSESESKHCIRVLRLKRGDEVRLVDGRGGRYSALVESEDPRHCLLVVKEREQTASDFPYYLHIGIAPTKNMDRMEWFLEKVTEIGVNEITPVICERSERRELRVERLERVVVAAMKQSLKSFLPVINDPLPFSKWISTVQSGFRGIAHCMPGEKISLWDINRVDEVCLAIGPEGDFTEDEVGLALKSGFTGLDLGTSRLRTETAGVVAVHGIQMMNGIKNKTAP
ncbi:MAG: 16S rRNA (uracil(1498)-N(3))-methyltransferase [Bacteroidota bacterium]